MTELTYSQAIREALTEEMERDDRVLLFGEDVGAYGGVFKVSEGLYEKFGEKRVIDTPTSEIAIAGAAVGAAMLGARPVAEFQFIDFMASAMDQIANQAAKMRYLTGGQVALPIVFRTPAGAGGNFAAQHSQSLEAWFCHIPGLKVVMPATAADAKGLLKSAIRDADPVVFIEQKMLYSRRGEVPEENDFLIPLGSADIKRAGSDVTLVAIGGTVIRALEAASRLAETDRIEVEVIDPRSLVPLDLATIVDSVRRTSRLVIVQEAHKACSVGASLALDVLREGFGYLDAPVGFVCPPSVPVPYPSHLEEIYLPTVERIETSVRAAVAGELPSQDIMSVRDAS